MTAVGAAGRNAGAVIATWLRQLQRRIARPAVAAEPTLAVQIVTWVLMSLAGLAVWLVAFGLLLSGLSESHAQHVLYDNFRKELALGTAPLGGAMTEGTPVALLTSSAAGLDGVVVVEGTSSSALRLGPGHMPGLPLPGQAGVSIIMGRATTFGAPFADVTHVHAGDKINAVTGQGTFTYVVEDVRRPGDPFPPALAAGGSQLTLVTSEGSGWRTGWAPSNAVYVDAVLKGAVVPAPSTAGIATDGDQVMHHDSRGFYPLILWLQLLLVAVVGGIWARSRWGYWQSWLVAVPVAFAGLWGASQSLWLLLPNLL